MLALLIWADLTAIALLFGVAFCAQIEAVRAGTREPTTKTAMTGVISLPRLGIKEGDRVPQARNRARARAEYDDA